MALTDAEISDVKHYLGYDQVTPDIYRGSQSYGIDYNAERLTTEGEARVRLILTELESLDTSITAARGRLKAVQVGDLRLEARRELHALRSERRTVANGLAALLGVENRDGGGPGGITV